MRMEATAEEELNVKIPQGKDDWRVLLKATQNQESLKMKFNDQWFCLTMNNTNQPMMEETNAQQVCRCENCTSPVLHSNKVVTLACTRTESQESQVRKSSVSVYLPAYLTNLINLSHLPTYLTVYIYLSNYSPSPCTGHPGWPRQKDLHLVLSSVSTHSPPTQIFPSTLAYTPSLYPSILFSLSHDFIFFFFF